MKKALLVFFLALISMVGSTLATNPPKNPPTDGGDRLIVQRLMDAAHLYLDRKSKPTAFTFKVKPEDSIRIDCYACAHRMRPEKNGKVALKIAVVTDQGTQELSPEDLNAGWMHIPSKNGRFSLVFSRGEGSDKTIELTQLRMWRKTHPDPAGQ